jgi:excisionase family DNA binding protein
MSDEVKLLTRQAVCARVSLSKTKVYDLIRDGRFPKAHEVEPGIRRWRVEEVDAWINRRAPVAA